MPRFSLRWDSQRVDCQISLEYMMIKAMLTCKACKTIIKTLSILGNIFFNITTYISNTTVVRFGVGDSGIL